MRRRWPKILKLGNVYVGILKPIGLVGRIAPAPVVDPFKVAEWYVEYQAAIQLALSESQDSLDELVYNIATVQPVMLPAESQETSDEIELNIIPVQTVTLQETQDSSDTLSYCSTTTDTSAIDSISEWYAEYKTLIVLSYSEEQNSSDALVLHELVTTHPDTFEISEWYAEYSVA